MAQNAETKVFDIKTQSIMSLRGAFRKNLSDKRRSNLKQMTMMDKDYFVYIMTNKNNNVLYTGVTNNLVRRVYEHKQKMIAGFTKRYNITKLVYYEIFEEITRAITREKQIKAGSRKKKIDLINAMNLEWKDLYEQLV